MPNHNTTVIRAVVTAAEALELSELLYSLGWSHGTMHGKGVARSSFDNFFSPERGTLPATVSLSPGVKHFSAYSNTSNTPSSPTFAELIHMLTPNAD